MTHSPTSVELTAVKTGYAALLASRSPNSNVVETIVYGLGAAGLLMDPEIAEELRTLRAKVAETAEQQPMAYALTPKAFAAAARLRCLLARSTDPADASDSPCWGAEYVALPNGDVLTHTYPVADDAEAGERP